jgi:hypothetical protein
VLGNVKIYFGKVIDITDDLKIFRCRISIDGYTEEIEKDNIPWYFPWYGINYLPIVNDIISIIIFDNNFSTGFYGKKVDLTDIGLSNDDYENYLEIFKRTVADKQVSLIYTKTNGIEFINDISKINLALDKITLFNDSLGITITKDKIEIGDNTEASLLGDKTVSQLKDIIAHQNDIISALFEGFQKVAAGCTTPFTAPIAGQLTSFLPKQVKLTADNKKIDANNSKLQSKKIFNG